MKDQTKQEVSKAVERVISNSTKLMPQNQSEDEAYKQSGFSKKQIQAALKTVQNKEVNSQQRRHSLHRYIFMKNSNLCSSNPNCGIGDRSTFHGDSIDYSYPYSHRYNEPDSDRGATDE